jgi:hypothetical protein
MDDKLGRVLRTVAIVLMGLTAAMNLLGSVGTSCVAFFTEQFPKFLALLDYRWLYQALVITTVPLGIANVWATIALARGRRRAGLSALALLVIGTVLGAIHWYASLELRGEAAPANVKFYTNALTLLVFLLLQLPGIRERVDFSAPGGGADRTPAGGLAAIVAGCVLLSTAAWAGPSHTYQGSNWVHLLLTPLDVAGAALTLGGLGLLLRAVLGAFRQEVPSAQFQRAKGTVRPTS